MKHKNFDDYLKARFSNKGSGTCFSYLKAIQIIDNLLKIDDIFGLNGRSVKDIKDPILIERIVKFVAAEENKFRKTEESIFDFGSSKQTSYPQKRFCTAAIRQLSIFVREAYFDNISEKILKADMTAERVSPWLINEFNIDKQGDEREISARARIGQDFFRSMLLKIYSDKCCLTGLDVIEVLRASHIIPWAKKKATRLDPRNGMILSATYDAAFDKHLISFDEDYRMILNPIIQDAYSSKAFKKYFKDMEGKKIEMPIMFSPSQEFLAVHREEMYRNN